MRVAMRAIDQALVDEVWWEVTTYEGERATAEARVFLERQPYVGEICRQLMKEFDPEAQRAAMGLTFLLFKIVETSLGAPFPTISRDRLIQAYEAITEWTTRTGGSGNRCKTASNASHRRWARCDRRHSHLRQTWITS